MDKKYGIICAAILFLCCVGTASARIWYVDDGGGADFTRIQDAIIAASAGDTIIVRDGNYTENVDVDKSLTIQSENGSANCIVHAESLYDCVFKVTADYVNISGFTVEGRDRAIYLDNVDYCSIANNNCSTDKYAGIELRSSNNNTLTNNTALNSNNYGIIFYSSSNNILTGNLISGISLHSSSSNLITNNNISNNDEQGIYLSDSNNNILTNNVFKNNGIHVYYSYQNTVKGNTVNGKPLVYLEGESDLTIGDAGQVILVNCDNITIENLNLSNANVGVELWNTGNSKIMNNTANRNVYGIYLNWYSNNNILTNNTILNNVDGIRLDSSSNNILMNNTIKSNKRLGVSLSYSNNNILTNNTFVNNGISVGGSYPNTVEDNTVNGKPLVYLEDESDLTVADAGQVILVNCDNITVENLNLSNASIGVELRNTNNSKITNNIASNNYRGIFLGGANNILVNNTASNSYEGIVVWDYGNNTLTGNTANSNEEYGISLYSSNNILSNNIASNNSCGIRLTWADNNTLMNTTVSNNDLGICLSQSSNNNTLMSNMASNNRYGIYLDQSSNNTLTNNIASNNNYGIYLWSWNYYNTFINNTASNNSYGIALYHSSDNNSIYLNNFINNSVNVDSSDSTNIWNSTEKITYTYNGSGFENYLGNYWNDYTDIDANNDGIWDHPRSIDSDWDYHPLVEPWENYIKSISIIRIGYQPSTHHLAHMTAMEKGWWEDDLKIFGVEKVIDKEFPSGPPEMHAMFNGEIDVAYIGVTSPIAAIDNGLDAKIIAGVQTNGSHLVLRPEINYTSPGDLRGLKIATFPPCSVMDIVLKKWLVDNGLDPESDLEIIMMGPEDAIRAIENGEVDGVFLPHPLPATIELNGSGRMVVASGEMWPNHACCCLVVSGKLIREHPEIVKQIIKTHIKATDYNINHHDEAAEIYVNKTGSDITVANYSLNTWDGSWVSDPYIGLLSTMEYIKIMKDLGCVDKLLTEEDLFDFSFYNELIIFDTGSPSNPYPSIMGNHTGTIKPNHTVIATKLYTYPCEGTGGHTEYARIWNKTWNATATWEGYAGDWHNITFDKTVVLLPNKTYNYTIRTGSYPQIHHNRTLTAPDGKITCTKFTDANGRVYYDWIPAIRLE